MSAFFHVLQVLLAIGLIGLVLIQHGKGADAGAAFGSGASATVFGSQGSGNFLSRSTAILAALFFINSLILAYFSTQISGPESVITSLPAKEAPAPAPATDLPLFPANESVPAEAVDLPTMPGDASTQTNNTTTSTPSSDVPVVPVETVPTETPKQE